MKELDGVLQEQVRLGVAYSLPLVEARIRIEQQLIGLLEPSYAQDERRRTVRVPCQLPGRLRTFGGGLPITVSNISCGGARVELDRQLEVDEEVEVELELQVGNAPEGAFFSRFGRVCWAQGTSAGIAFEQGTEPLDQYLLRFILDLLRQR